MSDKDIQVIEPVPPIEPRSLSKTIGKATKSEAETVKLTHDTPGAVRGAFSLTRYKPDDKGVIVVDVRDAETLKQKWGWRDA